MVEAEGMRHVQSGEQITLEEGCLSVPTGWITDVRNSFRGAQQDNERRKLEKKTERGFEEKLVWIWSLPFDTFQT